MRKLALARLIAIALFLAISSSLFSQTPTLVWAGKMGGSSQDQGQSIATDAQGNIYAVGSFRSFADLDPSPGVFNQTSAGVEDAYITKTNPNGGLLWAKRIGGTNTDRALGVATDPNGEVYVTGTFMSTVDFDPNSSTFNMTSFGQNDIFVLHLDANGDFVWAQQIGGTGNDNATSIHITSTNNVLLGGYFSGTADFDPGVGTQTRSAGVGTFDGFVLQLTIDGDFDWVATVGSPGVSEIVGDVTTDASGNVIAVGSFQSIADFDPGVGTFNLTSVGEDDAFCWKLTSTGSFIWAKGIGGQFSDALVQVETDAANNVVAGGYFADTVDFDPGVGVTSLVANGNSDVFLEKLSPSGTFTWVKRMGAAGGDASLAALDLAANGTVYAGGNFMGTADFDPGVGTFSHTSQGYDGFFWKLDANGQYIFSSTISSTGTDVVNGIQYGPLNAVFATGYFSQTADFDPGAGTVSMTPAAGSDAFIFKLRQCSPSTGSFSATACSNYPSPSGHQVWTTSGVYQDTITNVTGCDSFITATMTFNPPPAQPGPITGGSSICIGASQTYSIAPVSGATGYTWTLPSGWTGTSTTTSITVTATGTANSGFINVATNAGTCVSSAQLMYVTVSGVPAVPEPISGNAVVCAGTSQVYTTTPIPNTTGYTWTFPSGWTGTSTTNSITATAGTSSGTITITADNACGSSPAMTKSVTVNNVPTQPAAISGTATLCARTTQVYSIASVPGTTGYTWTLPSGWTGSSTTTSISATANASSGTISVVATNSCGNSPARTLSTTVIDSLVQPGAISGVTTVCTGTSQVFSITAIPGASNYIWTLPSGWSGSSTSTSITATAGTSGGTISVVAVNMCDTSALRTLSVAVTTAAPAQPSTISGNASICVGANQTYSITPVSGATSYTWTLPSGWSGSSTSSSITATAGTGGGTINVTANNGCGSSTAQTVSVTVNNTPAQPAAIVGNATVCNGTSQVYTITAIPGATDYTWTLPSGWSGSSNSTSITVTAGTSGGTISVTANNSCGTSTARTLGVTVNSAPAQPVSISGTTTMCTGTSQVFSIAAVSGATGYTWTLPSGWSGSSTSTSITATAGASSGTISVVANNTCGNSLAQTLSVTVNSAPAQPAAISGNATICAGASVTYSIVAVPGATAYTWNLPSGWTGSSTTTSITATAGASSGTVSVTADNGCGTSTARTLAVTVNNVPAQPAAIAGNTTVCLGGSETYSITAVPGATGYTWTLPSGWTGSSTSNTISTTVGANAGTISVIATNGCGNSTAQTVGVTVSTIPAQPAAISGNSTVCMGGIETYSIAAVPGATSYTWTLPSGWLGSSTSTSITVTAGTSAGTISVVANNACGISTAQTAGVTVNSAPAQPASISGNVTLCAGDSATYAIAAVSGATGYTWTLPTGWSGSSNSNSITATAGASGGNITVTADNGCGNSTAQTLGVTVNTIPAQPSAISGNASGCEGDVIALSVTADPNATSYTWTLPSGWAGGSTTNVLNTTAGAGNGIITVVAGNACGSSVPQTIAVSGSPAIVASFSSSTNMNTVNFSDLSTNATAWAWDFGDGGTGTAQNPTHTYTAAGTYQVCLTATNAGCMDTVCNSIVVTTVGATEELPLEISVFPNPSSGQFMVEVMAVALAEVYSMHGQRLVSQQLEIGRNLIDLTGLSAGMYLLQVDGATGKATVKLVKRN